MSNYELLPGSYFDTPFQECPSSVAVVQSIDKLLNKSVRVLEIWELGIEDCL